MHRRPDRVEAFVFGLIVPWAQGDNASAGYAYVDPAQGTDSHRQGLLRIEAETELVDVNELLPEQAFALIGQVGVAAKLEAHGNQDGGAERLVGGIECDHDHFVSDDINLARLAAEHDDQGVPGAGQDIVRIRGQAAGLCAAAKKHDGRDAVRATARDGGNARGAGAEAIGEAVPTASLDTIQLVQRRPPALARRAIQGPKSATKEGDVSRIAEAGGDSAPIPAVEVHAQDDAALGLIEFAKAAGRSDRQVEPVVGADGDAAGPEARADRQVIQQNG